MRTKPGLTEDDLIDARRLVERCNRHEGLDLSFTLEGVSPSGPDANEFVQYDGEHLVGLLTLQDGREIEVCLAVDPKHRRRGIGRSLLEAARREVKRRGRSHWLLVCEETSRSGQAFVHAIGAQYRFSEYRMRLDPKTAPVAQSPPSQVRLRQAGVGDVDDLARLIATSFDRSAEEERARVARDLQRSTHRFFIAHVNGEPVGSLGVAAHGRRVYIIAFNVLPQFRRRGYGRAMLAQMVAALRGEVWDEIVLEVATENRDALTLYRSCGFHEVRSYGYYGMEL